MLSHTTEHICHASAANALVLTFWNHIQSAAVCHRLPNSYNTKLTTSTHITASDRLCRRDCRWKLLLSVVSAILANNAVCGHPS